MTKQTRGFEENGQNKTVELLITDFTDMGQGVGRIPEGAEDALSGLTVFVEGAYPGDTVRARITKVKKSFANAETVEILEASEDRLSEAEICPYAGTCGGCVYAGYSYEGQLRLKEKQVCDKLTRLGGLEEPKVNPIIGMSEPAFYRNKAEFAIGSGGEVGFFSAKSHKVIDCKTCLLQMPSAMAAAEALRQYISLAKPSAYDRATGKGLLRGMVVKTAPGTGEVMVIIVATGEELPQPQLLVDLLDDAIYNAAPEGEAEYSLESVIININRGKGSEVLGEKCITLAGKPAIRECAKVGNVSLEFEISPLAFYQVNTVQMEKLYGKALEYAALEGDEKVFDLYCGVGTIGLFAARQMSEMSSGPEGKGFIYGIESVKGAILDANRNAVINGIVNARYFCGRAEDEIGKLLAGYTDRFGESVPAAKPDVVILDPPRAGCDERLLEAVSESAPSRIVYVSCDPATLARDVKYLTACGYEFIEATPVDMFPHTGHCETVCLLSKLHEVTVDFGGL